MVNRQLRISALALTSVFASAFSAIAGAHELLYTQSNDGAQNEVYVYLRQGDGNVGLQGRFATGGRGAGNGLGSQGALAFSRSGRHLFVVNAGSNELSVFRVTETGLQLLDKAADAGQRPISVAVDHNTAYVVNAGDDSIYGYYFDVANGKLQPIPGSYQKLSGNGVGPAQISFSEDGKSLVVTEKATSRITTFTLDRNDVPVARNSYESAGKTPFGFSLGTYGRIFVTEAQVGSNGPAPGGSTVSSYEVADDGSLTLLHGAVPTGQTAACWSAVAPDGRRAFVADTPADAISSFSVDAQGKLTLVSSKAATESRPTDLAVSRDGVHLYTLNTGDRTLATYRIEGDSSLRKLERIFPIPAGASGLLVR